MNQRQKEQYLREYAILKSQGKPFFPYAVAKDSVMACIVMACIIGASLVFGAELGSKANPTTTTYVPRPEWYFFFLFELLRVIKPSSLVPLATIGVPTLGMILLFLLPFYDRGPERRPEHRPIATLAGIFVIGAMALLTYQGATAGSPTTIELATPASVVQSGGQTLAKYEGQLRGRTVRLPVVPQDRRQRQQRARAQFDPNRLAYSKTGDRAYACEPNGSDAVLQATAPSEVQRDRRIPLAAEVTGAATVAAQQGTGPGRLEAVQVRAMFDRIAGIYDLLNSVMTAGLHHQWRVRAADLAGVGPGSRVLDVATGTGDLALELARRVRPGGRVVGSDFSEAMLDRARRKGASAGAGVLFEWADVLELPYAGGSFDAVTVGFGARNFEDLASGLAEMARVVRPGGRVVVLEFTTPTKPPLSTFYRAWFDCAVPVLGRVAGLLSGLRGRLLGRAQDTTVADAYAYLPASVKSFAGPAALAAEMERAGLEEIHWLLTAGGIVAIHVGVRPSSLPFESEQPTGSTSSERVSMGAVSVSGSGSGAAPSDEDAVETIMRRGGSALREQMERIESYLEEVTSRSGVPLSCHANATVTAGGKRLRPLLVVLAAQAAGGPSGGEQGAVELVRAAVAVELVHSATLVHDDVVDRAKLRRGQPTVAALAGRNAAIATGDLLFSRAFAELARNGDPAQLRALSDASTALAAGEMLQREDAYAAQVSVERYMERCELKTAALFEAACRLGALVGVEGSQSLADALGRFARSIGLAFQLLDDVLDISGPVERTGKARGTDLLDGTVTLPLILARQRDERVAKVDLASLHDARQAEALCDLIAATDALEVARERALEMVLQAKSQLPASLPNGRSALLDLVADAVVERYR